MSYIIPYGSLQGRSMEDLPLQVVQMFVANHVQPEEMYLAARAELARRGELPAENGSKPDPSAFTPPAERRVTHIPDSLAEISRGATATPAVPAAPLGPASSQDHASHGPGVRSGSASESIPLPCGHATSDLGWIDGKSGARLSACMACERIIEALAAIKRKRMNPKIVLMVLEANARLVDWPHATTDTWRNAIGEGS